MEEKALKPPKKNHTLYSIFGVIGDIIFYPVIVLSLLSSFFMFYSKKQGNVPEIFGISLVQILSGSMEASGFQKGHSVFVENKEPQELMIGDIIAFYYYEDKMDKGLDLTLVASRGDGSVDAFDDRTSFEKDAEFQVLDRKKTGDLDKKTVKVYFHQIIKIYYDDAGTSFYVTKGTSNGSADSIKTREDYVVGKYIETPMWIRNTIHFCTTALGMILIVITPLSVLVMMQSLSIIEQVNNILLEKKVIERRARWDTQEAYKANIGIEMDVHKKIYFYAIMPEAEKPAVWNFVWGFMGSLTKQKDQQLYSAAKNSVVVFKEQGLDEYFKFWKLNLTNKKELKNLDKIYGRYRFEKNLRKIKEQQEEKYKEL